MRALSRQTGRGPLARWHATAGKLNRERHARPDAPRAIAQAYDHAGEAYGDYADGDGADDPSCSTRRFAHADAIVWATLRKTIDELRRTGVTTLRILDAGCGPGTWIRRLVAYARPLALGIEATGFDIAQGQLEIARKRMDEASGGCQGANANIRFLVHNLADPLPWTDREFHIVLCNYIVLNHLDRRALPGAIRELCRVAKHRVITTLRAVASPVTGCIIGTEEVSEYHQDCRSGELRLVLKDGSQHVLTLNLYSAQRLRRLFEAQATVMDLRAVDLFLSRFVADDNWTGKLVRTLPGREHVVRWLREAEETLCRQPAWLDHGTHVLLVAQPRAMAARQSCKP
jgi:ubiquinone/menaquinone biosynthesis C-methylase UbiE